MSFKMKIKFDEKTIAKAKGKNITDFDDLLTDLKTKFGEDKRRKKQ